MSDKYCKEINTIHELYYAGIAMDYFYERNNITPKIEELPAIPMESTWSLRPFICGLYINRFRIIEGTKVVSVVLKWFNSYYDSFVPRYDIIPLGKFNNEDFSTERCFEIDQVQEIHDHIKFIFDNWYKNV